jgi:hypothetical protein
MDIREVVSELLTRYKAYEELLTKETDALLSNDVSAFKDIVNEKINVLEELTEYEQNRVSVFGQKTLNELLDENGISHNEEEVLSLMNTIENIKELTETTKLLMDQNKRYNSALLEAIKEVSNRGTTYSGDKRPSSKGQSVKLIDKSI